MEQYDRSDDDGEIPGVSDAALSARDVENARADGAAADLIGTPDEHHSLDGAYGDPGDPAMEAVIEGGGGVSEGFEQAEEQLVEHATDSEGSTRDLLGDAIDEDAPGSDDDKYGEADHSGAQGRRDPDAG